MMLFGTIGWKAIYTQDQQDDMKMEHVGICSIAVKIAFEELM